MRASVYVDGFILYFGALRGIPFNWLNPIRLTALLLSRDWEIRRLRYFTARVSGKFDPRAPARQRVYLKALATQPEVAVHYGHFLAKTAWCPPPTSRSQADRKMCRVRSRCPRATTQFWAGAPRRCRSAYIRTDVMDAEAGPVPLGRRSLTP